MSIAPPRYAAESIVRVGRGSRIAAIFEREVGARAGVGTWLVVAFAFLSNILVLLIRIVIFPSEPVGLSAFSTPYGGTLWPLEILLVTAATGAGSIAEDLASRSITLYLSRPIHLVDYLGGKAAGLAFWIGLVAMGPGVVAAIMAAALGGVSASIALSAILACVGLGLLATAFFTGLALALSAWTARALYAGVAIFGLILGLEISVLAIWGTTGNAQIPYLSVFVDLQNVAYYVFQSPGITSTYPGLSAVYVGAAGAFLILLTWLRLERVEVVGE